jgi:ribosome-binding factor A
MEVVEVVCMAHPRRVKMVQQQIHRELADMLLHDTVLQQAIVPESGLGADMYLSSMATITDVEISNDLQVAKVFVSLYGDEREQEVALEGLKSKAKYVRMGLGKRMSLRMTPDVRFVKDESLERGSRVLELLDKVKKDRERKESGDTSPRQPITPVDDDYSDFDLDFEDKDDSPITPKPKKKRSKSKAPDKATARKAVADDYDVDWDDDEFKDLDFNDDENIIYIK